MDRVALQNDRMGLRISQTTFIGKRIYNMTIRQQLVGILPAGFLIYSANNALCRGVEL